MSYIVSAVEEIARHLHPGMLVILESTTYPGTTDELVQPMLEQERPRRRAATSSCASRPSASIPGNPKFQTAQHSESRRRRHARRAPRWAALFYAQALETRRAGQLDAGGRDGEAAREHVPHGQHRPGQRDRADVRPHGHQRLGSDRRGGDQAVRLHAVLSRARASAATASRSIRSICRGRPSRPAFEARFIELAGHINGQMPHFVVDKVAERAERRRASRSTARTIHVMGVAYKRDIDDMRESPALDVMHAARSSAAPRHLQRSADSRSSCDGMDLVSGRPEAAAAEADCVVIITDHAAFDYPAPGGALR